MAKSREVVSISEIARHFGISRQSVRNWVERHDDFPAPIISAGRKFIVGKGEKAITYLVNDPGGRTKFFDFGLVKEWVKAHGASLRSQSASKPKAAAKPAAKKSKGKTSAKSSKKATAEASKPSRKPKTDAPAKKGKKKGKKSSKA